MGGEELAAIFTIRKGTDGVTGELIEEMETSSVTSTDPLDTTKDTNNVGAKKISEDIEDKTKEGERERRESLPPVKRSSPGCGEMDNSISTKRQRTHQQNENQQTVQCPLCQVKFLYTHLRQHLTQVHNVAQDCVDKLISAVTPSVEQLQQLSESQLQTDLLTDDIQKNKTAKSSSAKGFHSGDSTASVDSHKNKGILVEGTEGDIAAPKDVTALLTPPLEENTTHPSNGTLVPQSPTQTPPSSPPASPPSDPPPLLDRHGYRFRCSRCSLAFPTQEKLQLHWQYHAMRAATECPLCSRQCRSQEALQRHMQNTHSQQDNTQAQNTLLPPHTVQYTEHSKNSVQQDFSLSPQVGQEAGEGDEEELDEEAFGMEEREEQKEGKMKEQEVVSEVGGVEEDLTELEKGTHEEIVSEPSSGLTVKKSSNPTMDRYLDPSRPYKCTICSESFTQKTILLVHYNSVSHLHRARRALQDTGASALVPEVPRGPDPRPYRCRLCGVGYSQSSTLDIHLRSVLHQTRARAAQNSSQQTTSSTLAVPVPTTAVQAATLREETSKNLSVAKKQDGVSSSTSSVIGPGLLAETQPSLSDPTDSHQAKKRVAELLASRNQLMLIQQQQLAQAQVQAQLQQTALFQSQAIQHHPLGPENLLKQHFSLVPDNLLSLQQQLLLPFYLSGDVKLNPEFTIKSSELGNLVSSTSIPKEQVKTETKESHSDEKEPQKQCSSLTVSQPTDLPQSEDKVAVVCSGSSTKQMEREHGDACPEEEKEETLINTDKNESQKKETVSSSFKLLGPQCPPPRVPYAAANGEPLRALLQSYGYELALQYIQSRHRHQQQIATQIIPSVSINKMEVFSEMKREEFSQLQNEHFEDCNNNNKEIEGNGDLKEKIQKRDEASPNKDKKCCETREKCGDCGKFFSDALILKSHREYIHRMLFPTAALERYSREYRLQYDQMYPISEPKPGENSTICTQTPAPATNTCSDPDTTTDSVRPQVKNTESSPMLSVSDPMNKVSDTFKDLKTTAPDVSPSHPQEPQQLESLFPGVSTKPMSQTTTPIPLSLPKIPMLPLSLPQLPLPPLTIPKLPLPPIPFSVELPLLSPVVMQSMALQTQPWLDSSVNPELAKLYQSQLTPALLGQQPQLSPALLAQQPQPSPALLGHPPQLSPTLLSQPTQPTQTGQQSQVSPVIPEQQQGKRTRTRITEEQLSVLRKHFDINSLPSDEEINKMSDLSGLPHRVIKHWFRNTLFKERQRDKDSPYNFNNPPTTALEESREDVTKKQLTLSPCSLSPGLSANTSPQPQPTGEHHRGRRSSRTRFTEQQLETLQGVFEATPYPREEEYDRLSALLSLPNRVIVVWFQNARQRARKNQDRGTDDGLEGKNQLDNISRQRSSSYKTDVDNQDNSYEDEGQGDSHNENSMDLTYEYYTHPDSPSHDSSTSCSENEHLTSKREQTPAARKHEDTITSPPANLSPAPVDAKNRILDTDIQQKEVPQPIKTGSYQQPESPQEKPPILTAPSSQKTTPPILSVPHSDQGSTHSPDCDQKVADPLSSPASAPESEAIHSRLTDATACLFTETQPQLKAQAQFQCSLCPASLPSFQLWQEHQTRHLLAAQSQVQLFHSGFADRTMPYMMLHPNHTLMASQMLSGAMSQIPPNPTHPMISHLNSIQMKSTFSDHSSITINNSLTPIKQSTKHASESGTEGQRSNKDVEDEHRRDKRQRTTITPEQLEVLYQRYSLDSNPTRGVLESIARDVGLTRRVVQVWFQNTRARERKGQFRSVGPGTSFTLGLNHLRCPFCRAHFKVKSALDAHIRSRHWVEAERAGYNLSISSGSNGQTVVATSSVMERPGPSISTNSIPNSGYDIINKESTTKLPVTSLSSSAILKNPEEDDEYEDDDEDYPCEESSSMADQGSPSPEISGDQSSDWSETHTQRQHHHHQQQRQRTQMSHFQILQLKDFYRNHRTPNRLECDTLGQELGLPPRVVQVWFQNARAKEKRARSLTSDSAEREQADLSAGAVERDRA